MVEFVCGCGDKFFFTTENRRVFFMELHRGVACGKFFFMQRRNDFSRRTQRSGDAVISRPKGAG